MQYHLVSETFYPETNGVAMTLHRLTLELVARDISVSVIRPQQKEEVASRPQQPYREHLVRGFPIPSYPELRFGFATTAYFKRLWLQERPSLVHVATEGPLGFCAIRAARALKIPVISSFHTNFHEYGNYYRYTCLVKVALSYLKFLHNKTEATYAPSDDVIVALTQSGFRNVRKLGRGVDSALFSPQKRSDALRQSWGVSPDAPVFLYTGRVASEKNIPLAIQCFEGVKRRLPAARMVIVGDGPLRKELEQKYSDVIFCGVQRGEALAQHYASADLFLFPSITETFGNVVTEAMASGLVVVSYDYAASKMLIESGTNGFTSAFNDTIAFEQQLLSAAQRRAEWPSIREKAREAVLPISWSRIIDEYLATLEHYKIT